MKKKLREHLIMLANQILEEERTFETSSMRKLVIELHEKLTVLEYLENQLEDIPEVGHKESLDSKSFREENWFTEPEPVPQPTHKEDLAEPLMEKIKDIVAQMPQESDRLDEFLNNILPQKKEDPSEVAPESTPLPQKEDAPTSQKIVHPAADQPKMDTVKHERNELEEFASAYQQMPEFERKNPELFPPSTGMRP